MTINFFWLSNAAFIFFIFHIFCFLHFHIFCILYFHIFCILHFHIFGFYIFTSFVFYIFKSLHLYIFTSFAFLSFCILHFSLLSFLLSKNLGSTQMGYLLCKYKYNPIFPKDLTGIDILQFCLTIFNCWHFFYILPSILIFFLLFYNVMFRLSEAMFLFKYNNLIAEIQMGINITFNILLCSKSKH